VKKSLFKSDSESEKTFPETFPEKVLSEKSEKQKSKAKAIIFRFPMYVHTQM
jgi:hypothetical protein